MKLLNNKFLGRVFLIIALLFSANTLAQDVEKELSFDEKLKRQETQEHESLLKRIRVMDDAQYKKLITDRISSLLKNKNSDSSMTIVVDVTEEMGQKGSSLMNKKSSTVATEKEYGVNKVEKHLEKSAKKRERYLKYKQKFSSENNQRHFQTLEGFFTKSEAMALAEKGDVIDVQIVNPAKANFSAYDANTGRILPRREPKQYSEEFLNTGYYEEVMKRFEKTESAVIEINFNDPQAGDTEPRAKQVEDFLSQWKDFEFEVLRKSDSSVYLQTTKAHIEAIKTHEMVGTIRTGGALFSTSSNP